MAEPAGIEERVRIRTRTGSTYEIARAGDHWYFRADNVPNPRSRKLPSSEWWSVYPHPVPWPPALGASLMLLSPDCPTGGKVTSMVRVVQRIGDGSDGKKTIGRASGQDD